MALTAAEQYSLELINRARLDPAAEAARYGINLNAGLAPGTISTASKQVLAPNALLESAAIGHSQWMLAADVFSHTGNGGSTSSGRITSVGYSWTNVGENLAVRYTSATINLDSVATEQHKDLFLSAGHRANMMNGVYQEVGIAQERGMFNVSGQNYDASMLTEDFGKPKLATVFVTGVAYNDTDHNNFYSIGEGRADLYIAAQSASASSQAAGGYALALSPGLSAAISGSIGALAFTATVALNTGNVKLDVVNGTTFLTSGNLTLGTGINNATLLGLSNLELTGNDVSNALTGNGGSNKISGGWGNDGLHGGAGLDKLYGGSGADRLFGDDGNDLMFGEAGNDVLTGGVGADRLNGGAGTDRLIGGIGADAFVFAKGFGKDTAVDFVASTGDTLVLDDALWGGVALTATQVVAQYAHVVAGGVIFQFAADTSLMLTGLTSTAGLAGEITFI